MTTHITKQQIHGSSPYHMRRHEEAQARVAAFASLKMQGLSNPAIGRVYGITGEAVRKALRRAEGWTR